MGQSKVELFFDRVAAAARPAFAEVVAVQRHSGLSVRGVRTIFEEAHPEEAPLLGVIRALQDAAAKCVILAVDYPLVTADLLRFLRETFEVSRAPMLVPVWNGIPQTLCAGYDASLLPLLRQRVQRQEFDLRGLIAAASAEMIAERSLRERFRGEPLTNVNTPAELEALDG